MKKDRFTILLAAAAMLAACTSNEFKNDVKDFSESSISFTTLASRQTKAADNNKNATNLWNLENHHTSFDVWAWKYYNGAWVSTAVYNKGSVNYSSDSWTTTGTNIRFWDKSAEKYIFYAAAPTDEKWTINNNGTADDFSDDYLTYANFTLAGTNINSTAYAQSFSGVDDVDLMIAENNQVNRAAYNKATPEDVNEKFDHILSRLNVTVALKAGGSLVTNNATVKVTNFAITGVSLKNKGSFNEGANLTGNLEDGTTQRWNTLSVNGTYNLSGKDISTTALNTTALYIAQYLIIPQSITNEVLDRANGKVDSNSDGVGETDASHPYFVISYTINGEPFTAYYNLANAFGKTGTETLAFNEGWQNTLNIQIDADIITFDAQVYEWTNAADHSITIPN